MPTASLLRAVMSKQQHRVLLRTPIAIGRRFGDPNIEFTATSDMAR